jgi:predicted ATP-grasp superfamily ATP-dependent carboligase
LIVLVTDGDTRAALELTRALGSAGKTVFVTAPERYSLAGLSRWCDGEFLQADADVDAPQVAEAISRAAALCSADLVVGVTDRTLTALHGAPLLASTMPPPHRDVYFAASDKTALFLAAREAGIPVPRGVVVRPGEGLDKEAIERLGSRWALRPALSWRWDGHRWLHGVVRLVDDYATLEREIEDDPALSHPFLIQEVIEGDACGLFLCAKNGKINALFSHRRMREKPPWGGVSTLCKSVAVPADLESLARRYVEKTGWSGLAMLEFKRDRYGKPYLLEINARPWGSLALARAAGVDFPAAWLSDSPPDGAFDYCEDVHLRWWWGEVDHYYLREKSSGGGGVRSLMRAFLRALTDGPRAQAWDTFRRDDPLPFVRETMGWMMRGLG